MSITRPIPPNFLYLYILLLHLTISFAASDGATDGLINHVYTTHRPLSINLEDVLRLSLPSKITSDSSSCDLQTAFFFQSASLTLKGSFSRGEKVFQHGDMYYVLRIDPGETKITLVSYKNIQDQVLEGEFIPEYKTYTFPSGSTGPELFEVQFKESIALFSTVHDLVIIDFEPKTGPELIGVFDIHKSPIQAFGIVGNYMYVAGESAIVAYNIQGIANVDIRTMNTFYTFTLPDKQRVEVGVIQGICTCQDIWFFAEKNKIFAVKQDISIFSGRTIPVTKVISTEDEIIQIKRVGRSLVILTPKEVIEYVFVKNCLDYTENLRIPSSVYEFDSHMSFKEARIYLNLKGSDKGRYFSVVNHLSKSVYIFEVATMMQDSKQLLRPFYTHKSETNIDSIELHENLREGVASLTLAVRINSEKAGVVILQRQPLSLMCSSWRAKSEIMHVQAKSRFCQNVVYNYTEVMEGFKEEKRIPDQALYQDPEGPCERSTTIAVNYEWKKGTGLFVCIIIVLALAVIVIVKVASKKKKKAKYGGHVRLHNEKKKKKSSPSHKIEISSFSYGGESEKSKEEEESSSPYNRKEKKKKKKSTKKKVTIAKHDS